jgi:hypothetical protein
MHPGPYEDVRMWRPQDHPRLLLMHGTTAAYAVEPDGAYILGLIVRGGLRARRGAERHVLRPATSARGTRRADTADRRMGAQPGRRG